MCSEKQNFITGSTQFSEKVGVRESLSGRMGLLHLHPLNLRDVNQRKMYWNSWPETTIFRDLQKVISKNYDPEFSLKIIHKMVKILTEGEYPTVPALNLNTRKAKRYVEAMLVIFLLRKIPCHEIGVGHDHYIFMDSGLFQHLEYYKSARGSVVDLILDDTLKITNSLKQSG